MNENNRFIKKFSKNKTKPELEEILSSNSYTLEAKQAAEIVIKKEKYLKPIQFIQKEKKEQSSSIIKKYETYLLTYYKVFNYKNVLSLFSSSLLFLSSIFFIEFYYELNIDKDIFKILTFFASTTIMHIIYKMEFKKFMKYIVRVFFNIKVLLIIFLLSFLFNFFYINFSYIVYLSIISFITEAINSVLISIYKKIYA